MKPLLEVKSGDFLASGLFPGLTGEAGPLWRTGENVIFDNGGVRKSSGLLGLENLTARPTGIKSTLAQAEPRAFIGYGNTVSRYRSADGLTNIASFAAPAGVFQFVPWDTWALISNAVDPVQLWQNAGMAAPITAPFTRANTIFKYHIRAFAGGTDNGGGIVEWSPPNQINVDWTPTALNGAGNLPLRELEGDIVAAQPIGSSIGIYGTVNAGLFYFAGGAAVYAFRKPIRGVSAISAYSVVSDGEKHFGLTMENAFVTDLVSYTLIDEPAMRKWIKDNVDWDRVAEVYGWPDWSNNLIRWAVPVQGGGTRSIGFRKDKGTWTLFNDDVVAGEEAGPFRDTLLLKPARLLRQDKSSVNNDGSAFASYVQTKPLDAGDRNRFKKITKISLDGEWSGDAHLALGFSENVNQAPTWVVDQPLANEIFPDEFGVQSQGVFVHLKIYSEALGANWLISGAKVYGEYTGKLS